MKKTICFILLALISTATHSHPYFGENRAPFEYLTSYLYGNPLINKDTFIFNTFSTDENVVNTNFNQNRKDGSKTHITKLATEAQKAKVLVDDSAANYIRGDKRYFDHNDPNCLKIISVIPVFPIFSPICQNTLAAKLPSVSNNGISGTWSPAQINTNQGGLFIYTFMPFGGQNADTITIPILIVAQINPIFSQIGPYNLNQHPDLLPSHSLDGISGTWFPPSVNTSSSGTTSYIFTPDASQCAATVGIDVQVNALIDTTEMPATAAWYSTTWIEGGLNSEYCDLGINIIQVMRDTLIENKLCRIIGVTDAGKYLKESEIPFYAKNNRIYFHEDNEWKLLYNFDAKVGDTITYSISNKAIYYSKYGIIPFPIQTGPFSLFVTAIDTVYTTSGKALKRFQTLNAQFRDNSMQNIIEKVGSVDKLFGNNIIIVPPECNTFPQLRCYIDSNFSYKFVEGACDYIDALQEEKKMLLSITPNPGVNQINIIIPNNMDLPLRYEVLSVRNHRVATGTYSSAQTLTIEADDLLSGMYIVRLMDMQGRLWIGKWVKL